MNGTRGRAGPSATRYRITCQAMRKMRLPDYMGSALRGAFGWALRQLSCITGLDACTCCPLYRCCPYPEIFETPPRKSGTRRELNETPRPYVIEPPPEGKLSIGAAEQFRFHVVLMGRAQRHADLVQKALTQAAIGGLDIGRFDIIDFSIENTLQSGSAVPMAANLEIQLLSPLRLVKQGKLLDGVSLKFEDFIEALVRRMLLLNALHDTRLAQIDRDHVLKAARDIKESGRRLAWEGAAARWSNRQKRRVPLGGVTGRWHLAGDFLTLWPLLNEGQWTHVGKETTFGLGQYRVVSRKSEQCGSGRP